MHISAKSEQLLPHCVKVLFLTFSNWQGFVRNQYNQFILLIIVTSLTDAFAVFMKLKKLPVTKF
jgi:hypothetical protein